VAQPGKKPEAADNFADSKMSSRVLGKILRKRFRYDRAEAQSHIDLPSSMKKNDMHCIACHSLQPEYVLAPYLSAVKGFKSRKLISRFRCGCHGLHVDTGRLLPLTQQVPREQRHCVFCASGLAEDEHHFVFDCPALCHQEQIHEHILGPSPYTVFFFYST